MEKRIYKFLLPVDGSQAAGDTVAYVSTMLNPAEVELVLLAISDPVPESFWDIERDPSFHHKLSGVKAWARQQEQSLENFLEETRGVFEAKGFAPEAVTIKMQTRKTGIARDIVNEALKGYYTVVVGRRGRTALAELAMGSVCYKLINRLTGVPLWVVGRQASPEGNILVAMDSSLSALKAVEYLAHFLEGKDHKVTLFHARRGDGVLMGEPGEFLAPADLSIWLEEVEEEAKKDETEITESFAKARQILEKAGLPPQSITAEVASGVHSRAQAIVDRARQGGFGTIVVGRRGLSNVSDFPLGRVSHKVLQLARGLAVWVVA
ncbi:MAG: universal stress protein [Deltaproteobacteria bacterium]|nr:universal stress protein [Deltaproteobacteria bacterium]